MKLKYPADVEGNLKRSSLPTHILLVSTNVHQASRVSSRAPQDSRSHKAVPLHIPLYIPLHSQSPLNDIQMVTSQTQRKQGDCNSWCYMGRLVSKSYRLSGVECWSGSQVCTIMANETKSNTWGRRRAKKVQYKSARLTESDIVSTAIV